MKAAQKTLLDAIDSGLFDQSTRLRLIADMDKRSGEFQETLTRVIARIPK
jgi:hypothetical protein